MYIYYCILCTGYIRNLYIQIHTHKHTWIIFNTFFHLDEDIKEHTWWFKLPGGFGCNNRREGRNFLFSLFDVSSYNLRQASKVVQRSFVCQLHSFFWSFKPTFSEVFINSSCQNESFIWKIVQPLEPMFTWTKMLLKILSVRSRIQHLPNKTPS